MKCPHCHEQIALRVVRPHPKARRKTLFRPEQKPAAVPIDHAKVLQELKELEEQRPADLLDIWKPFISKP